MAWLAPVICCANWYLDPDLSLTVHNWVQLTDAINAGVGTGVGAGVGKGTGVGAGAGKGTGDGVGVIAATLVMKRNQRKPDTWWFTIFGKQHECGERRFCVIASAIMDETRPHS